VSAPTLYSRHGQRALDSNIPASTASVFLQPVPSGQTLYDMAQIVLERTKQCFTEAGLSLPARQVIYMSPIPADCEQLAVLFSGWTPDHSWDNTAHCNSFRWLAGFNVAVTRCTPAMPDKRGNAPSALQMNAAAKMASDDAEAFICVVRSLDEIASDLSINTSSPQGGFQTTELNVSFPSFGALE
jgi:hypothetical protein